MKKVIVLLFSIVSLNSLAITEFNIIDYGAKGDNNTINTKFIQAAIDACYENGGGRVLIPQGEFLSGTIELKSNITLFLEQGAVLLGVTDMQAYKNHGFIFAENQHNISITGPGKIDGQGEHPIFHVEDYKCGYGVPGRPHTIRIITSKDVILKDFTVENSTCFCIRMDECVNVKIDGLSLISRVIANNDGIDVADCHNMIISNCYIDCGDDAICPKGDHEMGMVNLTITNCIIKSESNGIKFGTGSLSCFRNVAINNCVIYDTRLSGIALEMVDGGILENFTIGNITMDSVNGGIFIKLGHRNGEKPGVLRDIKIHDIVAKGIGLWQPDTTASYYKVPKGSPLIGMSILGLPGYDVENVTLSNISLEFAGGGTLEDAKRKIKDRPDVYPEYNKSGITPAYGINVKHAKGIQFYNIQLSYVNEDLRPAFYLKNVKDVDLSHLKMDISDKASSFIKLEDVEDCFITNCRPVAKDVAFLEFEGKVEGVSALNNDLSKVKKAYIADKNAKYTDIDVK